MKPRVCITIPNLHGAGCERMLSEVLPFYAEAFDIDLVLQEDKIRYDLPKGLKRNVLGVQPGIKRTLSSAYRLRKHIRQNSYDAIVSYLDTYNFTVWLSQLLMSRKPVHIACEHTTDREFFQHSRMSASKQSVFKGMLRMVYNRVDRVITVSENLKDFLIKDLRITTPIDVIHNAVDPAKFNLEPADTGSIDRDFLEAKVKLLCISRLDHQKNVPFLLRSFRIVANEDPAATLFILGDGPLRGEVEAEIATLGLKDRVRLLGFRTDPENYLKLSDIFVLSSRYESFGNVVVEALACGVPVVTTDYGRVVDEILTGSELGEVVKQGDEQGFAAAIIRAMTARETYSREAISSYALDTFSISQKAEEYVRSVRSAIEQRAVKPESQK